MMPHTLPDLGGDGYETGETRRARALRGPLMGRSFLMYLRYYWLVINSGILFFFTRNPQALMVRQSRLFMRILEWHGAHFLCEGLGNFPIENGPYVFACNHMSILDVHVLPGLIATRVPMTFVIKESLLRLPFYNRILRKLKALPVTRTRPGEDLRRVLDMGSRLLSEGTSIVLFPEGTRHDDFRPSRFNSLAVKLALTANVSVVPVAVKTDYWGVGKIIKDFGPLRPERPVHVAFGEPVRPEGRGKREQQSITGFIASRLREWGATVIDDESAGR